MYIDHLEIYYSRELIRKLHGIKSAVLFKVTDVLRITNSYNIEHYFIFSQSAIKDTSILRFHCHAINTAQKITFETVQWKKPRK